MSPEPPAHGGPVPLEFHLPHSTRRYRRTVTVDASEPTPTPSWDVADTATWNWTLEVRSRVTHHWRSVGAGTATTALDAHHAARNVAFDHDDPHRRVPTPRRPVTRAGR